MSSGILSGSTSLAKVMGSATNTAEDSGVYVELIYDIISCSYLSKLCISCKIRNIIWEHSTNM